MVIASSSLKKLGRKDRRRHARARSIRREYTAWATLFTVLRFFNLKRISYRVFRVPRVKYMEYTDGRVTHVEFIRSKPLVMRAKAAAPNTRPAQ